MKKSMVILFAVLFCLFIFETAYATLLTFEDLAPSSPGYGSIPSNYGGFNWSASSGYITKDATQHSGYINGTLDYVSLFAIQAVSITMRRNVAFDFLGAYLNCHWNTSAMNLILEGSKNGVVKYSTTINFNNPHNTTWYDFEYFDIDFLNFKSNEYIVVDNFTFNEVSVPEPVPEPATIFLLCSGLIGLGVFRRKFRRR